VNTAAAILLFVLPGAWNEPVNIVFEGSPTGFFCRGDSIFLEIRGFDESDQPSTLMLSPEGETIGWEESVLTVEDGGYMVLPESDFDPSVPEIPIGVVRMDSLGMPVWTARLDTVFDYESPVIRIEQASSGGCWTAISPRRGDDVWKIWKLNEDGMVVGEESFQLQGGPAIGFSDLVETAEGGLLVAGYTDSLGLNLYSFVASLSSDCSLDWLLLEDHVFHSVPSELLLDENGNIYLTGETGHERDDGYFLPPVDMNAYVMKLNGSGEILLSDILQMPLQNRPVHSCMCEDGGILMLLRSFREDDRGESSYQLIRWEPSR